MKKQFSEEQDTQFDEFIAKLISNWYVILLGIVFFVSMAYLYNTYAMKQYKINGKILVQNQQKAQSSSAGDQMATDIAAPSTFSVNLSTELQLLKSKPLIRKVVKEMQLNVTTLSKKGFKKSEVYEQAPFSVNLTYKRDSISPREYAINIKDQNTLHIVNEEESLDKDVKMGEKLHLSQYDVFFVPNPNYRVSTGEYEISIVSEDQAVGRITSLYSAELTDKEATTIDLSLSSANPKKGEIILQKLMNYYLNTKVEDKKRLADSTIALINARVALVEQDLKNIEQNMQQFKSSNNIANMDEQSRVLVGNASESDKKARDLQIQLSVLNDLQSMLQGSENKVVPSALNVQNASFSSTLQQYNELLLQREKLSLSYTESNPIVENLDNQISSVRSTLLQNVSSYKSEIELSIRGIGNQSSSLSSQIQNIPEKERISLDYSRQQTLKQQLYTYLLQKREEAAISQTTPILNETIVENAKSEGSPFKPNKIIIYLLAFVVGAIIPTSYLAFNDKFNIKVATKADIENYTDLPIIGEISHNSSKNPLIMEKNPRSVIGECFRTLRTLLQYELDLKKSNVIMFTSSSVGEGKTFLSGNLGATIASSGKKVVILELDLRKPKLSPMLGYDSSDKGFTDFVLSGDVDIESIVRPVKSQDNTYIVSAGTMVSNPSELLMDEKLGTLINYLKLKFDFILIDSPPLGLVSDSLLIEKYVDMTFFVIRQNHTYKSQISYINKLKTSNRVRNLFIIINDIETKRGGFYGYSKGYVYDPAYVGDSDREPSWLSRKLRSKQV